MIEIIKCTKGAIVDPNPDTYELNEIETASEHFMIETTKYRFEKHTNFRIS